MTEKLWPDERIKARADTLDGELYDGNTRPWQHYMNVWRTLSYEMRDDYEAKLAELRKQIDADGMLEFTNQVHREHIAKLQADLEAQITVLLGANQAALARYAAAHTRNGELSAQVSDLQAMTRELRRQVAQYEDMEPELPEWAKEIQATMRQYEGDGR
jgi:chromosome segregation ATPase